ncbi:MAG TPA: hypothetical protein PK453_05135 [Leptospiraceae bacterium]|nr:hypothetical protein [Leptospiraceae bacterium]HNM02538.1 hypothetical protein [Leptospiraceae bacterium]HNO24029.1 hypothetical protein [Leptospiraceae bacterium]
MNKSNIIIWNFSDKALYESAKPEKLQITEKKLKTKDWKNLEFDKTALNFVFAEFNESEWKELGDKFIEKFEFHPEVILTLAVSSAAKNFPLKGDASRLLHLESPARIREIRYLIERTVSAEAYKKASIDMGASCLENIGFFEGLFDLARKEQKESKETVRALENILEYEGKMKQSQEQVNHAMETVNHLRDQEMIDLYERIKATENLELLREQELREALKTKEATEAALLYSRQEELHMDRIIEAHTKLFKYSEEEFKKLLRENIELKKRLGIPVEED